MGKIAVKQCNRTCFHVLDCSFQYNNNFGAKACAVIKDRGRALLESCYVHDLFFYSFALKHPNETNKVLMRILVVKVT
jgi:hypothetical protein